jgi:hypothetical protein
VVSGTGRGAKRGGILEIFLAMCGGIWYNNRQYRRRKMEIVAARKGFSSK